MKKTLIVLIFIAVVTPLAAQEMEPPPIAEAAHNGVVAFLQLTDEQVVAWDEVYWIHRDAEQPLKKDIALVQADIDASFEGGSPDPEELGELVIERHALGEALWEVHVLYHEAFVALLDETQVRRLKFIARADDVQKIIPAFKLFELIARR